MQKYCYAFEIPSLKKVLKHVSVPAHENSHQYGKLKSRRKFLRCNLGPNKIVWGLNANWNELVGMFALLSYFNHPISMTYEVNVIYSNLWALSLISVHCHQLAFQEVNILMNRAHLVNVKFSLTESLYGKRNLGSISKFVYIDAKRLITIYKCSTEKAGPALHGLHYTAQTDKSLHIDSKRRATNQTVTLLQCGTNQNQLKLNMNWTENLWRCHLTIGRHHRI